MNNCHLDCAKHCYLLWQKPKVIFHHLQLLPPVHCQRGQPGVSPGLQRGSLEHEQTKRRGGGKKRGARRSGREFVRNKARLPFILLPHSPHTGALLQKEAFRLQEISWNLSSRPALGPGEGINQGGFTRPGLKKP